MWHEIDPLENGVEGTMPSICDGEYIVAKCEHRSETLGTIIHLIVFRTDAKPIRGWDDLQRVKNEVVGEDVWAYEVYPPEDYKVSTANARHLWCLMKGPLDFGYRFRATRIDNPMLRIPQKVVW